MNGDASGLEFRGVTKLLVTEPAVGIQEAVESFFIKPWHFRTSVCLHALQPMDSPNLRTRTNIEKRKHVGCTSAGDDYHSRPAVANDLLQEGYNPGIWISLVALGVEWCQSSVVIDQQYCMPCLGDSSQKRRELRLHFRPQCVAPFSILIARLLSRVNRGIMPPIRWH